MKCRAWKLMAAAGLSLAMAACGGSGSGSSDGGASGKTGDTVKIGLNFELSGDVAQYGTQESEGAKLAIDQFNAREDKPFTVEAVEIDDKGDAAESTTAATKLITEDGVAAIVGPATSSASIATYAVASENSVPVISPSTTQVDAMLNAGEPYEYAWRVCFEDSYQGAAMALYSHDTLKATKAVIVNETSDYGQGLANAYKEEFEKLGGSVVAQEQYNAKDTDFASMLTKLKGKDFDVMYIAGYYNEAGLIIKQAREDGIDTPIVGADGFDSATLADLAGTSNLHNVFYTTAYTTIDASDELQSFIDAYKEKYNKEPGMFSALAYDATNLVLDQLEATGATGKELNEAIKKADFTGITGSFTFDEATHTPQKSVLVVELDNGAAVSATEVSVD